MIASVQQTDFERELLEEVSRDHLWEYVSTIAQDERMSGSPEERKAMEYIARKLRSWDVEVHEYEHDGYVSKPVSARLRVLGEDAREIDCITHAFATSSEMEAEVVYAGWGTESDYDGLDVAGKIVLAEGLATPGKVVTGERHGAAGFICINDHNLHQMIVTPIWGTPTPESVDMLPSTPSVSIRLDDGNHLKEQLEQGPVRVALQTEVWTGWARLPIVTGTIRGEGEPDRWVMLAGHVDSWFKGAIDNAAANATTLEVMRILAEHREHLRRGFHVVFWSGHSHGRYAGSTWYADRFWEELHDECVAYVNVDSTGAIQATLYEEILAMSQTAELARGVIADLTGQDAEVNRVGRAGDQSFWGIGIPSVYMSLSRVPVETAPELSRAISGLLGRKKSGQAWFWHTEFDTLDKVDLDVLKLDTQIYLATILRLCNSPILPIDYVAGLDEIIEALERYKEQARGAIDLDRLIMRAEHVRSLVERLNHWATQGDLDLDQEDIINDTLVDLGHQLVPINYTEAGRFHHDPALHAPPVAALQDISTLSTLAPESDEYRFRCAKLMRQRNQVLYALRLAEAVVLGGLFELDAADALA